jgi:hypothetical protein
MAITKTYLGLNPDGTPHFHYESDGAVLITGPIYGTVTTEDGTGSAGTVVPTSGRAITAGFTTKYAYSAEPSTPTLVDRFTLTPNGGTIIYDFPYGDSPDTAVSNLIGLRCTAPAAVNVNATMWFSRC